MRQFKIKLKPSSKMGPLIEAETSGDMTIYLREPALDGKANLALIKLIAEHFDIPKSRVQIISGVASRFKMIRIND